MLIRSARPADAGATAAVHVASWQATYRGTFPDDVLDGPRLADNRLRLWQQLLGEPGPRDVNLVAETPEQGIVGLLHARPSRDVDAGGDDAGGGDAGDAGGDDAGDEEAGDVPAEIVAIYAVPAAWGTGAGRELMAAALGRLRDGGFRAVTLWVLDSNERARRFYELAGFAPDGTTKDEVMGGVRISEVRYRRAL